MYESINDWTPYCPDITECLNDTLLSYEAILFQADFDHRNQLKGVLAESWNATVTDSCTCKTVCGWACLDSNIDSLSEGQKASIVFWTSSSIHRFKDGNTFNATKKIQIPEEIGIRKVLIETDIINSDASIIACESMNLNELIWTWTSKMITHKTIELVITKSAHCAISLSAVSNHLLRNSNINVTLTVQTNYDKKRWRKNFIDNSSVIRQKGESQNGSFKKTKHTKFSEKWTFLPPDRSCYKFVCNCNLAIQETRSDSQRHHEVLDSCIRNSWYIFNRQW